MGNGFSRSSTVILEQGGFLNLNTPDDDDDPADAAEESDDWIFS